MKTIEYHFRLTFFALFCTTLFLFGGFGSSTSMNSFLPHTGSLEAATRTSIYQSLVSRRATMSLEVKNLKDLQKEIETLAAQISADPFNDSARLQYAEKVAEGKRRAAALAEKVSSYNSYLAFIAPAFRTQGVGWANLYYKVIIPTFASSVAAPADEINDQIGDASATYPIPGLPTKPTLSITATPMKVKYGETINLKATVTGSGTLTVKWETDNGTLSESTGLTSVLTAPTGTDGKDILVTITATAWNEKDSVQEALVVTATSGVAPEVTIQTASGQTIGPGKSMVLNATATGEGELTIQWGISPTGTINPTTGKNVMLYAPATAAEDTDLTITAKAVSSFGPESSEKQITVKVAGNPTLTITTADGQIIGAGQTLALNASKTGTGEVTVTWSVVGPATISPTTGTNVTLTASSSVTTDNPLAITAVAKSEYGNESAPQNLTALIAGLPTVEISGPASGTRVGWGLPIGLTAATTGLGDMTVTWEASGGGAIAPSTGLTPTYTAPTGTGSDVFILISAVVQSSYGGTSVSPSTIGLVVGTTTMMMMGEGGVPLDILGNGSIGGDLTGK